MANRRIEEARRIAGLLLVAFLLGWILDQILLVLLISVAGYLGWHLYNLMRLERWLREGKSYTPPESFGLWGEVFTDIYRLQRRHKKRNKRLVKLISRFRETTEAMPDGVVVMDDVGRIDWWNDAAADMLDLKYPSDVDQRITNLIRNPEFGDFFQRADSDEFFSFAAPADEMKTISVRMTPYGKNQLLLVVRDVTLLQRVEQMRRDFVANISHELRTPLTVMSGFLEAMSSEVDKNQDEEWKRSVRLMQQQANRMSHLVEDLMLLSQLERGKKQIKHEVVSVPQLVSNLCEEAEILSGDRKHKISMEVDTDLFIYGDSKELDSAFHNLVVNAINHDGRLDRRCGQHLFKRRAVTERNRAAA